MSPSVGELKYDVHKGGGIHRCLGSHLARLELRVALREWHRRIHEYSVAPDHTLVYSLAYLEIALFAVALSRAWALVQGKHLRPSSEPETNRPADPVTRATDATLSRAS